MRKIVICPTCGFVGSTDEYDRSNAPLCPDCDTKLMDSGCSKEVWDTFSLIQKKDLVRTIVGNTAYSVPSSATVQQTSAEQEHQAPAKKRSRFPIFLLGLILGIVLGYYVGPKIIGGITLEAFKEQMPAVISQYLN